MTGLSVLYAKEATEGKEWKTIPDRAKTGRLREVYWARRAEGEMGRKSLLGMKLYWHPDRTDIGRKWDDPGDGFVHIAGISSGAESNFEWLEVMEVFTTVPPAQIEGAMSAWNRIGGKRSVDFVEFLRTLKRGRPTRAEQRSAADKVVKEVNRKLAKTSYTELMEKYGYGTLVVGMPLWFAVFPDDPFRMHNALDDFVTRTSLGLEEIRRKKLGRTNCPFKNVIVLWDTTPEAVQEWEERRSREYDDAANTSLENPLPASMLAVFSGLLRTTIEKTAVAESEMPSICCHLDVKAKKKRTGKGPYPEFVQLLIEIVKKQEGMKEKLKQKVTVKLCKLLCFIRIHGIKGLEKRIVRRMSVPRSWKSSATRRQGRHLYRESIRRMQIRTESAANQDHIRVPVP